VDDGEKRALELLDAAVEEPLDLIDEDDPASIKGKLVSVECQGCGHVFIGYYEEQFCTSCLAENKRIAEFTARIRSRELPEEESGEYRVQWFHRIKDGIGYGCVMEFNVNIEFLHWREEVEVIFGRHGYGGFKEPRNLWEYQLCLRRLCWEQASVSTIAAFLIWYWREDYGVHQIYVDAEFPIAPYCDLETKQVISTRTGLKKIEAAVYVQEVERKDADGEIYLVDEVVHPFDPFELCFYTNKVFAVFYSQYSYLVESKDAEGKKVKTKYYNKQKFIDDWMDYACSYPPDKSFAERLEERREEGGYFDAVLEMAEHGVEF